ncbi:hypothetical protein DFJ74DRAFT_610308 [Hyaloraphidium curvatum]|nr:hypothetical protein DFJ74DRAFT_610308 [Hyaloraphidium curvatum]
MSEAAAVPDVVVATRVHRLNSPGRGVAPVDASLPRDLSALLSARSHAAALLVAFDAEDAPLAAAVAEFCRGAGGFARGVGVRPWGAFVPALNALVADAARCVPRPRFLLLRSAEAGCTDGDAAALRRAADGALVAGKRLQGHDFRGTEPGVPVRVELTGTTVPWNTLAMWDLDKLALTGFLLASEGLAPGTRGGVEEAAVVALHQRLWPDRSAARLVDIPGDESWRTDWWAGCGVGCWKAGRAKLTIPLP